MLEQIRFINLNPDHTCKTYLFGPLSSQNVAIVDPELEHLQSHIEFLTEHHLTLKYIIDTHTHADHLSGAAALRDKTGAELIMAQNAPALCVSIRVKDGDTIDLEGLSITFITTPGHTTDSISVILPGRILTGDALFLDDGGAGRDDLPGGNSADHWSTLQKLSRLPEDLVVFPAHDYRNRTPSSLHHLKGTNPLFNIQTQEDYIDYLLDLQLGPADWMHDVLKANSSCTRDPKAAWVPIDSPSCEAMGTLDPNVEKQQVDAISPATLQHKLDMNEDFLFIDVRSVGELQGKLGKVDRASNIPLTSIMNDVSQLNQFKEKFIVAICGSGKRSIIAAKMLKKSGFDTPVYVEGGIKAWRSITNQKEKQ